LYFDHNATTPLAPEVSEALRHALGQVFGNASSIHRHGQTARQALDDARRRIAAVLGGSAPEIVFTSGGTEANNLAISGVLRAIPGNKKHAVVTAIEHPSVSECAAWLEREGVEVTVLAPDRSGVVAAGDVERAIRCETVLISVMHANNETGVIQPVEEIGRIVATRRKAGQPIYFHSDGVQAFGKMTTDMRRTGCDLYSISAHKIYGPKGIGALFARKGTPLAPVIHGGRQERERRPGTENVPAAVAFARAAELCGEEDWRHYAALRDRFEWQVVGAIEDVEVNGAGAPRVPNTSNLLFYGVSGEALLIALDLRGMAVSTGSACSSGSIEPSPVLLAMGRPREQARCSVRFSFGRYNTAEEADALAEAVIASVRAARMRSVKGSRLAAV
jgi:cysteine desulfurase